jgi:type I restriction enzyme S subunit
MSFPRYPTYKDSGVEWLGEVPELWAVIEARREFAFLTSGSRGWAEYYSDKGPIFLRIGNLTRDSIRIDMQDIQRVSPPPGVEGDRTQVSSGDVLFSITAYLGSVAVVPQGLERAYVSQHVCLARLTGRRLLPEWLAYSVLSSTGKAYLESESYGGTKVQLSLDDIKSFPLPLPSLDEQRALTSLLDRETAKIDALIAEQQRLIELLQEKRQAVISHAVTKGLNPEAPMKDSGVEWLGEVPEHWTLKRLKHLSPSLTVGIVVNPSEYISDEGLPFIYGGDIREGVIDWENSRRISPALSDKQPKTRLRAGDLLMVRVGAPGITAVVPTQCEGGNCASVMLIRQGHFSSQWLCFALNTRIVRFQVEVVQYGAAQEQFNISHAVNFWLPVPPRQEQDCIAAFLASEHEKAQGLILEAHNAVSLLQERRSALISAAVTGQIDVRGLVPEASAA